MSRNLRVAIVHPWFPQYREPFFRLLVDKAESKGINIDIFYGDPPPEWGERGDSVHASFAERLPTRFLKIRSKSLVWKSTRGRGFFGARYDLVILEQAVRNLETYLLMLRRRPVAFWGHGRTYTVAIPSAQERLKSWLTRRGSWFFGYTRSGVESVIDSGFPVARTTVVVNSIDTTALVEGIQSITEEQLADFKKEHGLGSRTAVFIGGLDEAKRIDFLLAAARKAAELDPDFRLLVGGGGSLQAKISSAANSAEHIVYLGPVFGERKHLALKSAALIAMPGRVGLVAVDSLATGIPVVTTDWPYHAPEFEYLTPGVDCIVTPDDVGSYAEAMVFTMSSPERISELSRNALRASADFSVEAMVDNFVSGLDAALRGSSR